MLPPATFLNGELIFALWEQVSAPEGIAEAANHLKRLLRNNYGVRTFDTTSDVEFLPSDSVHSAYNLLSVVRSHKLHFQEFFDLLQQSAEQDGLMELEDPQFDDFVPLHTLGKFINDFFEGFRRIGGKLT